MDEYLHLFLPAQVHFEQSLEARASCKRWAAECEGYANQSAFWAENAASNADEVLAMAGR